MEKLTLNEEKVWTVLKDFPNGIKAQLLMKLTELPKTTLYERLDSLAEKNMLNTKIENGILISLKPRSLRKRL